MATPETASDLRSRIDRLEAEIRELRSRLAALERLIGNVGEHATDRTVVQGKVSYDWQA